MTMKYGLSLVLTYLTLSLAAQDTTIPLGDRAYDVVERFVQHYDVEPDFNTNVRPWSRRAVTRYLLALDSARVVQRPIDRADLTYLFDENNEWLLATRERTTLTGTRQTEPRRVFTDSTQTFYTYSDTAPPAEDELLARYRRNERPLLNYFYRTPAFLGEVNRDKFYLRLNPQLNLRAAPQLSDGDDATLFENLRGLRLRAGIDDRVFIYTDLQLVDFQLPEYVLRRRDRDFALPGVGLYKDFESSVFNTTNANSYLFSTAYLGFNFTPSIGMRFGNQPTFLGSGYRSVLLSDFAVPYLNLQVNWKVWRFQLRNLFAELNNVSPNDPLTPGDELVGKKYLAAHYLDFQINHRISVGFYEAIVFQRQNQFELQYLNPVIFYRSVEQLVGSPDNALLGVNAHWDVARGTRLYGQFILDEFKLRFLISPDPGEEGWWANKYALQIGVKHHGYLADRPLMLQAEYNRARPYVYSHRTDVGASYTHSNQYLAHPLGSNFGELLLRAQYRPGVRWFLEGRALFIGGGDNPTIGNEGADPLLGHNNRRRDFGNEVGQGIGYQTRLLGLEASYEFYHGMFLDLDVFARDKNSDDPTLSNRDVYIGGGVRMNIARRRLDF